jgi:3-oxoacyl-[acyl-carrier-protein] synthase III
MQNRGNIVSSTIPIVLHHMIKDGFFKTKTKTLLAGFGAGYS